MAIVCRNHKGDLYFQLEDLMMTGFTVFFVVLVACLFVDTISSEAHYVPLEGEIRQVSKYGAMYKGKSYLLDIGSSREPQLRVRKSTIFSRKDRETIQVPYATYGEKEVE